MLLRRGLFALVTGLFINANLLSAELANHYTFDDANNVGADSSGNDHTAFLDDLEVSWVNDADRGGVMEFGGGNNGFMVAEIPDLADGFTIMSWVWRDPDLCCETVSGANDGIFEVQLGTNDPELLDQPSTTSKVIGAWVQKADAAVWGRVIDDLGAQNLGKEYFMDDEEWVHLAYRGTGEEFEVVVNGESGVGPILDYEGLIDHDQIYMGKQGSETWGGRLDDFRVYIGAMTDEEIQAAMMGGGMVGTPGDFDNSGALDAADVDALNGIIRDGSNDISFDLNNDAAVDQADQVVWIEELKNTYYGDANLDLEFNSSDFVLIFQAGKFETGDAATWAQGDWNGDGVFGSGDLVKAFQAGGFELGPRPVSSVPEPAAGVMLFASAFALFLRRRR